jgi:NRAMP (natural resistance-associated macrophage protein)-like metal ion transporter
VVHDNRSHNWCSDRPVPRHGMRSSAAAGVSALPADGAHPDAAPAEAPGGTPDQDGALTGDRNSTAPQVPGQRDADNPDAARPPTPQAGERGPVRAPHHLRRRRMRGTGYFKGLGPGLVTGAADDDPSGIGTYSQVGASLRFDMLWTAVVSLPLAIAVIELSARLGLVTDQGIATVVRRNFVKPIVYPVLALVIVANTFNIGADLGAMAASLRLLVPIPLLAGVALFAVGMTALEVWIPYRRYAKVLRWLVLSLLAYIAVLAVVKVPWGDVARHTFLPTLAVDRTHLAALIAIFGTTISPYLFFWQAAEEMEENDETAESLTRRHMRSVRLDVIAGATSGVLIMFAILVATAVTIGAHPTTIETADQAAGALRPLAGDFAGLLFAAGVVGTGLLAVPTLAGSSAYALAEAAHWREGLARTLRQAPGFYSIIIIGMAVGAGLNLVGIPPIKALYASAILNGLAAPPIMVLMLLASRTSMLGRWRSGWLSTVVVATAILVMTVLPLWYVLDAG